jgi:hypothetical protein
LYFQDVCYEKTSVSGGSTTTDCAINWTLYSAFLLRTRSTTRTGSYEYYQHCSARSISTVVANLGLHDGGPGKRRLANEQYHEKATIENEQAQVAKAPKEEPNEVKEINPNSL